MRRILLICLLLSVTAPRADVFRWTDADGTVHYSDKPLAANAKPVTLPPLQTFHADGATTPPVRASAPAPAGTPAPIELRITAPVSEETIRDAGGALTVEVAAAPSGGAGLVYYLDNKAQNAPPTLSTALLLSAVERGEHTVGVALVDSAGRELARASPVTFYMQPPRVLH